MLIDAKCCGRLRLRLVMFQDQLLHVQTRYTWAMGMSIMHLIFDFVIGQ